MPSFCVEVQYRTASGSNVKRFRDIEAPNHDKAITIANNRVRNMRGVLKIDGGDAVQNIHRYSVKCANTGRLFPFGNISNAVHYGEKHLMGYTILEDGVEMPFETVRAVAEKVRQLCS